MEIPDFNIEDLLRNTKIRVDRDQSEEVQAAIYSMGGGWSIPPDFEIRYEDIPFLYIDNALVMHSGGFDESSFTLSPLREISYRDVQVIVFDYYSNLF